MSNPALKPSRDGLLANPSFHDGYVTGLMAEGGHVVIHLKRVNGERYLLELTEVRYLVANDFREGNIISHIEVISGSPPEASYMSALFADPHLSVQEPYLSRHHAFVAKVADQIIAGEMTLIVVTPSYGCDLVALCKTAVLTAVDGSK